MGKCRLRVVERSPRILIAASFLVSDESLSKKEVLLQAGFSPEEIKEDTDEDDSSASSFLTSTPTCLSTPTSSNNILQNTDILGEDIKYFHVLRIFFDVFCLVS